MAKSIKDMELAALGTNIGAAIDGHYLHLVVRLDKPVGASKSGKSVIVGSTNGNATVATPFGQMKVGLNVYTTDVSAMKASNKAAGVKSFSVED